MNILKWKSQPITEMSKEELIVVVKKLTEKVESEKNEHLRQLHFINSMKRKSMNKLRMKKLIVVSSAGVVAGAFTYKIIGGIGIAILGTAVGINLGGFIIIGGCVSSAGYGLYWWGLKSQKDCK